MEAWTRFVLRHRLAVISLWLAVLIAGAYASTRISPLLSNSFAVPGTQSAQALAVLEQRFGERSDGTFTVVFPTGGAVTPAVVHRLQDDVDRAARVVPTGRSTPLRVGRGGVVYGDVVSDLNLTQARSHTDGLLRALGHPVGARAVYVTGAAAIQQDLEPIFNQDLRKGESIALPIALLVLLAVFGLSLSVTIPFIFAACTITASLGVLYGIAHLTQTPTYTTNLIELIGLGIAVDYSLLVVYRFREELARGLAKDDAIVRTMETAGRAVMFSGAAVALGLALLMAIPVPFMRLMGVAGFLIPVASILAAATLQPALLSYYGRRGVARKRILPGEPGDPEQGMWARLARSIMRHPRIYLSVGMVLLFAAAVPAFFIQVTPGSTFGIPRTPQSVRGFDVLTKAIGPGAVAPTQIVVRADGSVLAAPVQRSIARLTATLRRDPEVAEVLTGTAGRFVDAAGRDQQVIVAGRHDYGFPQEQAFVRRLRSRLIPAAAFPAGAEVLVGGGPAQGVDFLHQAYTYFIPLIAAVLVLTYFLLLRAFRSVILPLKAIALNLLSVAASYGLLVIVFRWGFGHRVLGLYEFGQVEGWIPIFLFAMLFGLSMDYEVFLVTRMREAWDHGADNATAVAFGLERTGRIITAAAVIMCAAFSGFVAGRIVGLQEFGVGLAVAVFVDATIVRCLMVPSMMALFGRWNWWLPPSLARLVRVEPSPFPHNS